MNIYDELKWRGLIHQETAGTKEFLSLISPITLYAGFDPTADSLHVGNLIPLLTLERFQKLGHGVIALLGGATGLIGDPSGRSTERNLSSPEEIAIRSSKIESQIRNLGITGILDNLYWTKELSTLTFLRDIGKYFSINEMLSKESVATRLETGISFTEFSYMLLQAFDFYHLSQGFEKCKLQIGGSDQWGNITAGIELIKKKSGKPAYGLTLPLITTANGQKLGKTADGAIWLDPLKTKPYTFYQYWFNTDDQDVIQFLKYFTALTNDQVSDFAEKMKKEPEKRTAQKHLALELTSKIHGREIAQQIQEASEVLFGDQKIETLNPETWEMLKFSLPHQSYHQKIPTIVEALIDTKLAKSKGEARREIASSGIYLNQNRITDPEMFIKNCRFALLRRGKKSYSCIEIN